jgi:hypothetical protein
MSNQKRKKPVPEAAHPSDRILKRGGLQLTYKDGQAIWTYFPVRVGVRKATVKEAKEFKKQLREGLGVLTVGKKRKSA